MMKFLPEGIHGGVPESVYHADPCASPSLSSGVASKIVDGTLAEAQRDSNFTPTTWPNLYPTLSKGLPAPALRVLSFGGGVQSTTLLEAAIRGDVGPMPDCAIFADTGWEPQHVLDHVAKYAARSPFPVYTIQGSNLRDAILAGTEKRSARFASVPFFILSPDGKKGMGRRQCTAHYKLEPIRKKVRELLGVGPRGRIPPDTVEMWIGISMDEIVRMVPSRVRYIRNRFPLIEADMNRRQCVTYLEERQATAAKSACRGCPFHDNAQWRDMRDNRPNEWALTVEEDYLIRRSGSSRALRGEQFMHPSCLPLDQAPIDDDRNKSPGLFDTTCGGGCWS